MKTKSIINLLTYFLIFSTDNLKTFSLDYIVEKYFNFFKDKPNNINYKEFYLSIKDDFNTYFKIEENMKIWNIDIDDENFDIYFFTYYLVYMVNLNLDYTLDEYNECKKYRLNKIIKTYKIFFKDFGSIFEEDKTYLAHQVLRNMVNVYIEENNRLFSLLLLKEKLNRNDVI